MPKNTAAHPTTQVLEMLEQVKQRARADIDHADPKAQALLETTAEVIEGLQKAYRDYEEKTELAWR
jgi:hypothetical protein